MTALDMGWSTLANGDLIAAAEAAGFDVVVTLDKRIRDQQNLVGRTIGIVVLPEQRMDVLTAGLDVIKEAIGRVGRGEYIEVGLPKPNLVRRPPPDRCRS